MTRVGRSLSFQRVADEFGCSGYVAETVPLAILAAERGVSGFEATLEELVAIGGDADTIASLFGQIVGTVLGYSGLPESLLARLPERELVIDIAGAFAKRAASIRYRL
jgi:ADP-ribosylglycohydrolase